MPTDNPGFFTRMWRKTTGRGDDYSELPSDSSADSPVKQRRTLGPRTKHVNEADSPVKQRRTLGPRTKHVNEAEIEEKCKEHCKYIPHPELDLSDEQIAEIERKCNDECNNGRGVMLNEGGRRRKTRKTRKTRKSRKSKRRRH